MRRRTLRLVVAAHVAALVFAAATAGARPGGGSSFKGSSSSGRSSSSSSSGFSSSISHTPSYSRSPSSSSSDDSGGGSLLFALLLLAVFGGGPALLAIVLRGVGKRLDWSTGDGSSGATEETVEESPRQSALRDQLDRMRGRDPDFSVLLFEDFVYMLYAQAHTLRGRGRTDLLAPWLAPGAQAALATQPGLVEVRGIVIGAMRWLAVEGTEGDDDAEVTVELETNLGEVDAAGAERTFYRVERWTLARPASVRSKPPERMRVVGCPNCGAPLDGIVGGTCGYCQAAADAGVFDWQVVDVELTASEQRGPMLTSDVAEQGTDLPTVTAPGWEQRWTALASRDPALDWGALSARIGLVFAEMQVAWSTRAWKRARPYVSDNLFQMLAYWIDAYTRQKLRNVTRDAKIERIEVCDVRSDRWYDAITVRVFASSFDWTESDDGRVVAGNPNRTRRYTEYWTLMRAAGRGGPARSDAACPNCGGPVEVTMAGECAYCRAKVTSGAFDWVLSRIEQDEAYG